MRAIIESCIIDNKGRTSITMNGKDNTIPIVIILAIIESTLYCADIVDIFSLIMLHLVLVIALVAYILPLIQRNNVNIAPNLRDIGIYDLISV